MCELLERIARTAATVPDHVALEQGNATLTYAALWTMADAMAHLFKQLGVTDQSTVAICLPRGFPQVAGALAAMRAEAAYLPLDPATPEQRLETILTDAGATVVLAESKVGFSVACTRLEDVSASGSFSGPLPGPEALAYVIYTSGSSGAPKGVEITHRNLAHLIAWHNEAFGVTAEDRASHLAGLGFDASAWEIWPYLAAGATVVLAPDDVRSSPGLLLDWLVEERITIAFVPTPLAEPMIGAAWPAETRLRYLLTGGDTLHRPPAARLPFAVINNYGPTECTVVATSGTVAAGSEGLPTIGKVIAGAFAYLLDEEGLPVATGESGELYIGGAGVGRGYRNLPEQTAACFVPDTIAGGRMYRTGDRAAQLASGEIAFLGRRDGQVKIRGQRLEVDEIAGALNRYAGVAASAVMAFGEGSEKQLVGYVVPRDQATLTARELRDFLAERLPAYMVPAVFVGLEQLPLNASGKLDRAALPEATEGSVLAEELVRRPATPIEERVLEIVRTLVKSDRVGVEDDFFLVGGHSLMGTQLIMRVRESFGVPLTLRDLFEGATVARLSARVETLLLAELDAMSEDDALRQVAG